MGVGCNVTGRRRSLRSLAWFSALAVTLVTWLTGEATAAAFDPNRYQPADIDGIAAEAIEFCNDQNVPGLQPVHEPGKPSTLCNGGAAGNRLGDDPARLDLEACGLDFLKLVLGGLPRRGDADIGEGARHGESQFRPNRLSAISRPFERSSR